MTSDLDIYRSAQVLIREHGEDAGHHTFLLQLLLKFDLPVLIDIGDERRLVFFHKGGHPWGCRTHAVDDVLPK